MFDLMTIQGIIGTLKWVLTLGKSEVIHVKKETDEVINEPSKSLMNLWDIMKEITNLSEVDFTKEQFENRYDYFLNFYFGDRNISAARTHCGNVVREVDRIKFKLAKILHTNIGRWEEADKKLSYLKEADPVILYDYDSCISSLHDRMKLIKGHFDAGEVTSAMQSYSTLKIDLENDINQLREGVETMELAINHINKIAG